MLQAVLIHITKKQAYEYYVDLKSKDIGSKKNSVIEDLQKEESIAQGLFEDEDVFYLTKCKAAESRPKMLVELFVSANQKKVEFTITEDKEAVANFTSQCYEKLAEKRKIEPDIASCTLFS